MTKPRIRRIVTVDLNKPRGVTRTQIKGLAAKVAEQLRDAIRPLTSQATTQGSGQSDG